MIESSKQIPNSSNKLQIATVDAMQMATTSGRESAEFEDDPVAGFVVPPVSTLGSVDESLWVIVTMSIRVSAYCFPLCLRGGNVSARGAR